MKIYRFILFVTALFVFASVVFGQKVVELQYPTYAVTAFSQPRSDVEMKAAAFITARQRTVQGRELRPFGIFTLEAGKPAGSQIVFDIVDAAKNVSIKRVSLDEYFGKETAGWQTIGAESKASPGKTVTTFRVQSGVYNFKLICERAIIEDANLPMHKKMSVTCAMESDNPLKIRIRFFGTAAGSWSTTESSFVISDNDTLSPIHPSLVFHPLPGSTIEVDRSLKKPDPVRFTMTTKEVSLSKTTPTIVFALEVAGTTLSFEEYIAQQAKNLRSYFDTHIGKPDIIVVSRSSKPATQPGDTLTLLLYAHNIGTAAGAENSVNNIIPAGSQYVEGSAEGKGTAITFTRDEAVAPQAGKVTNITWKFKDPIYPGEERTASFRVIIR